MPDRRMVDELTIEELEKILIIKRREARAERMRRLREIGRLPADAPLPHEDLTAPNQDSAATDAVADLAAESSRARSFEVEPVGKWRRKKASRRPAAHEAKRGGRMRRLRDKGLLLLEVGALLGLVAVVAVSLLNLRSLNDDYASASGPATATATVTPMAGGILPGGHQPPEEPGAVPAHLQGLVSGREPPPVTIPTPGPQSPTRVVIPAIDVDALVVEGDGEEQLKLGVGHHLNTANPGERGNMVLSAHNDIYGEIFRYLPKLELGDEVIVYAGEQPYRYVVTAKQIIEETEVHVLAPTTRPVATLISCYPYMVDTHRIVVVAELQ
jgi:sortase A